MLRRSKILGALLCALLFVPAVANADVPQLTVNATLSATGCTLPLNLSGQGSATLTVSGTWSGTVSMVGIGGDGVTTNTIVSTTSNGIVAGSTAGYPLVEACFTRTSGSAAVFLVANGAGGGGSGGGGGGSVTQGTTPWLTAGQAINNSGTISANASCVTLSTPNSQSVVGVTVSGTWSGVLTTYGIGGDGTTTVPQALQITGNGVTTYSMGGFSGVKTCSTSWTSGSATVTVYAMDGSGTWVPPAASYFSELLPASVVPVKNAPATVLGVTFTNSDTVTVYCSVFNALSANVTLGTTVPVAQVAVPSALTAPAYIPPTIAVALGTGFSMACTTTMGGSTAETGSKVFATAYYY